MDQYCSYFVGVLRDCALAALCTYTTACGDRFSEANRQADSLSWDWRYGDDDGNRGCWQVIKLIMALILLYYGRELKLNSPPTADYTIFQLPDLSFHGNYLHGCHVIRSAMCYVCPSVSLPADDNIIYLRIQSTRYCGSSYYDSHRSWRCLVWIGIQFGIRLPVQKWYYCNS